MASQPENHDPINDGKTSLEKAWHQALTPFEEFVHDEASSGLLLMACAVAALVIANTGFVHYYEAILHTDISFNISSYTMSHSLHHWINDGLMALFFLMVGLEIKREALIGELADMRKAILPISAAIGGMVVPALIYLAINSGTDASGGWGIPMATDIAFAVGVLALLGNRIPKPLIAFLLALAIVDDLGAVIVIAVFYTEQIHLTALLFAFTAFVLLILINLFGIRKPLPYIFFGFFLWLGMMESGIHATLAGVLTALTIPANSNCKGGPFSKNIMALMERFKKADHPEQNILENAEQQAIMQTMENYVHNMESPLQRMEHGLHLWVSFLIVPLFALANAGITIDFGQLGNIITHPVTLGITLGLVAGKVIGVFGFSFIVVKLGWSSLPGKVTMPMIAGVALLAGIGFTMSIFIAGLAFPDQATYLFNAKIGIILASLISGVCGYLMLRKIIVSLE
ncbi:MAG: Na+/H+ antiporter NhaA [Gammaproteobacteria bacterium]|nr:Na+/H+ antiporter NhaA [Gammaproteobacteria bacterium]